MENPVCRLRRDRFSEPVLHSVQMKWAIRSVVETHHSGWRNGIACHEEFLISPKFILGIALQHVSQRQQVRIHVVLLKQAPEMQLVSNSCSAFFGVRARSSSGWRRIHVSRLPAFVQGVGFYPALSVLLNTDKDRLVQPLCARNAACIRLRLSQNF